MAAWLLSDFFHQKEEGQGSVVGAPLQDISGSHSTYEEYDTSGLDRWDSYTNPDSDGSFKIFNKHKHGHSDYDYPYNDEECCPLVVDLLCLAAIIASIAGATVLISRLMMIELCMIMGVAINGQTCPNPGGRRRRRRRGIAFSELVHGGKNSLADVFGLT